MPDNRFLRIEKLVGELCPDTNPNCWWDSISDLVTTYASNSHKIIWFGQLEGLDQVSPGNYIPTVFFTDFIIDVSKTGTRVFYKDHEHKNPAILGSDGDRIVEDYVPTFQKLFSYFQEHNRLDTTLENKIEGLGKWSVYNDTQQLLTPETVGKIREASKPENKAKIKEAYEKRLKEKKEAVESKEKA